MDRAFSCGSLDPFAHGRIIDGSWGDRHDRAERTDPTHRGVDHFFGDFDGCSANVKFMALSNQAHDRDHASAQRSRHQIRRRKGLAFATVIQWSISIECGTAGTMSRVDSQAACVNEVNLYCHCVSRWRGSFNPGQILHFAAAGRQQIKTADVQKRINRTTSAVRLMKRNTRIRMRATYMLIS
jgi:hypothetical protein